MNLVFKFLNLFYSLTSFFQRKVLLKNIDENDLVLDVGSGDKPHWRADVIVDKYLEDDQQRNSGRVLVDKRKLFIKVDVEKLPFKDKAFDFVFCSHLLEHVQNPGKAIEEITRVGKKGYLEVPLAAFDLLKPFKSHLWFCELDKGELVFFRRKAEENLYTQTLKKFGQKYFDSPFFQYLFAKDWRFIFVSFFWKRKIKYRVIKGTGKDYTYFAKHSSKKIKKEKTKLRFIFYRLFYFLMNLFFYKKKRVDKTKLF